MHGEHPAAQVIFGWDPLWVATTLFVVTYAVIISERVNRAIVALLGAGLMIITGVVNQHAALSGEDFNTLGLLTGMMVIVAITRKSGVFQFVAIWSAKKVGAKPWGILLMLSVVTALFSALLDNVTTVLLIAPVTLLITQELKVAPYPYLFAEILASNIGGTATLIGDPPNIMIGSAVHLTFNDFLLNLAPIIPLILAATLVVIYFVWGRQMHASTEARQRIMDFNERNSISDSRLLKQSLAVLALVIAGFMLAHNLGLQPATIALFGAALLMLLHNLDRHADDQSKQVHASFAEVEWVTIFFFIGLFIVVHGIEEAGLLDILADGVLGLTGGDMTLTAMVIIWVSALFSALVDNIPFVATMIPLIKSMAPTFGGPEAIMPLWWSLALGACLGGNGSLIGASANLIVAGYAERAGHPIRFVPFLLMAFPMMLLSVVIATAYVYLRYLA
ncbi:MAG: ArsB/NhaD family transporter [Chromatiales bacterium]|jgi:Na+/H+ antiporter NhaD/arsenite permease-like protein